MRKGTRIFLPFVGSGPPGAWTEWFGRADLGTARERGLTRPAAIRLPLLRLLGPVALKRVRERLLAPVVWLLIRPAFQPARLLIAPQDIRTADPIVASDIYAGFFAMGGKVVDAHGRSPFEIEPPSAGWAEALHGFGWLRHLRAADTSLARANAQALIGDWMAYARRRNAARVVWQTTVVARRLISWLSQSPVILDGAEGRFYRQFMRSVAVQATFLQRRLSGGLGGEARLLAALAVAEVALCFDESRPFRRGARTFLDELNRQILTDGGHISRDPALLVSLLLDLLPLRQAYAARGTEVPPPLLNAIDRMIPMLRLFRHGDGSLALFNGMGVTQPDALATILSYDDSRTLPLCNATRSGYQRIEGGPSILICDTGRPPPLAFSMRAHAGTLSFEFSSGLHRLIVNCGRAASGARAPVAAGRATAAHSTLVLADTSSSRILAESFAPSLEGALIDGPETVAVVRREEATGTVLEASHNGYAPFGFLHRRGLSLDASGRRLEGTDELVPSGRTVPAASVPFALRFHLHPLARPAVATGGRGIVITLGDGERWLFETDATALAIEPSIFFASAEGPRRTEQIVIEGHAPELTVVRWSLTRES